MASTCQTAAHTCPLRSRFDGYLPIEDYGLIGNMHTSALIGLDGSCDFMCWPDFDSPSVFCRLLDKNKGGHFSISPPPSTACTTKQSYLPSSNILQTRYIHEDGVADLVDFFPRLPAAAATTSRKHEQLKKWLVRRVECVRGAVELDVEIFPALGYAKERHVTTVMQRQGGESKAVTFHSVERDGVRLQVDVTVDGNAAEGEERDDEGEQTAAAAPVVVEFVKQTRPGMASEGVTARVALREGQAVAFTLRDDLSGAGHVTPVVAMAHVEGLRRDTQAYWAGWISRSRYGGRWREVVARSLLTLKLLTYEPTGAIVAAPTFSVPEEVGGPRNWDYRYSWVRDSSFTVYILLRLGFVDEADAYMSFIGERILRSRAPDGGLPIMFTIRGDTKIPEIELGHLEGYRGSRPVRIGNGAAFHHQWDIYGELMDAIYLNNKYGKPVTWDMWVSIREMLDYVLTIKDQPDMSIWEVRNNKQNFVYSKVMLWVAFDRGLRLADKRNLPCPNRSKWLEARDNLYEEVMEKGYNTEMQSFIQSYENRTMLDSSILIAPLVFFITPNDPRFLNTMNRILLSPDKGGLTSTGLVYRYDTNLSEDGVGGREGAFSMCTFWMVEAMTRASKYNAAYLPRAVAMFENMLTFSNHLSIFSEEISRSGEQLGNTPQAFSHLALISAAFNLDRVSDVYRG